MIDEEMYALLSAYAAGTLTKDEEKRLFEKSLNNQTLFDALADEETMRATLADPLVKKQLLRTLNQAIDKRDNPIPPQNRWLWVAVAATLFVGAASIYYWPTAKPTLPETQQIAQVSKPAEPPAPAPIEESKPKPQSPAKPKEVVAATQPRDRETDALARQTATRVAAPAPAVEGVIAPPQVLIVKAPEQRKEVKAELADAAAPKSLAFTPTAGVASERSRNAAPMAKVATGQPAVELSNDLIHVRPTSGYLYMFLIDGTKIQPVAITLPLTPASARSLPMPDHGNGSELWFIYTPGEDPVLARALTGVLPLPSRPWVKLKLL